MAKKTERMNWNDFSEDLAYTDAEFLTYFCLGDREYAHMDFVR